MARPLSILAMPPPLGDLATDTAHAYRWLLEAWFIRLRWVILPLSLLIASFIPLSPWPARLVFPLVLASGNGWLDWRFKRVRSGACLKQVRGIATGFDCALGLLALEASAGTAVHDALSPVFVLLMLATAWRL